MLLAACCLQTIQKLSWDPGTSHAAHSAWLRLLCILGPCRQTGRYSRYSAFMFLNSGVRGPFVPSWVPPGWQWTMAFTHKLQGNVAAVSSSVTCLPPLGDVTSAVSAPLHDHS